MALRIAYRPRARIDLKEIYDWAAEGADPRTADDYVKRIQLACSKLTDFPNQGSPRDNLEPGLRSVTFKRRATIYYRVELKTVRIVRILGAGRDAEREFNR